MRDFWNSLKGSLVQFCEPYTLAWVKSLPHWVEKSLKLDPNQLVVAFGQACAYKLFSHKVYLVVSKGSEEIGRLKPLCLRFGLGLILFEIEGKEVRFYMGHQRTGARFPVRITYFSV
jgi:hypothetical protein